MEGCFVTLGRHLFRNSLHRTIPDELVNGEGMAGLSPKRPEGSWISRYRRRCLSAGGATIIFVTFLAKDAARDKLKSLIDSIDAAENSFIIRAEQRKAFGELKSFEDDFADFREHPT